MRKLTVWLVAISVATVGTAMAQVDPQAPTTARDYYERGLHRESAKQFDDALADYNKASELDPEMFDAHFTRSSLCAHMKDYRAAIKALTASLTVRPDV
jgi:tetratricopeptide (TPR) repeat protein